MCAQQKIAIVGRRIDSPLGVGSPMRITLKDSPHFRKLPSWTSFSSIPWAGAPICEFPWVILRGRCQAAQRGFPPWSVLLSTAATRPTDRLQRATHNRIKMISLPLSLTREPHHRSGNGPRPCQRPSNGLLDGLWWIRPQWQPQQGRWPKSRIFSHISTLPTRPRAGDSYIMGLGWQRPLFVARLGGQRSMKYMVGLDSAERMLRSLLQRRGGMGEQLARTKG